MVLGVAAALWVGWGERTEWMWSHQAFNPRLQHTELVLQTFDLSLWIRADTFATSTSLGPSFLYEDTCLRLFLPHDDVNNTDLRIFSVKVSTYTRLLEWGFMASHIKIQRWSSPLFILNHGLFFKNLLKDCEL